MFNNGEKYCLQDYKNKTYSVTMFKSSGNEHSDPCLTCFFFKLISIGLLVKDINLLLPTLSFMPLPPEDSWKDANVYSRQQT
jgi:hypothetical protein